MEGVRSEQCNLTRGVPQGSILGPLVFTLFVNDLPNEKCTVNLFADDKTIYTSDSNSKCVGTRLEEELSRVMKWVMANGVN